MTWNATQLWQQIRQEHILAIELADQRVGYIRYHVIDDYLYLSDLQLHSTRVGQGLGSRAIQFLQSMTKKLCLHGIRLRVFVDSPAIGLYERFGFVCVGEEVSLLKYEWKLVASDLHAIPPQSYQ